MVANCKGDLEKVKAIGAHHKWILNHISKSESLTYAIAAYKPALSRQVQAILSSKAGPLISPEVVLPSEYDMIKDEIFTAQHWAMNEAHVSASLTPYGFLKYGFCSQERTSSAEFASSTSCHLLLVGRQTPSRPRSST